MDDEEVEECHLLEEKREETRWMFHAVAVNYIWSNYLLDLIGWFGRLWTWTLKTRWMFCAFWQGLWGDRKNNEEPKERHLKTLFYTILVSLWQLALYYLACVFKYAYDTCSLHYWSFSGIYAWTQLCIWDGQ